MENAEKYAVSKLKSLRLRAEIATQMELSRRTGIAQCIISDLERGRRQLTPGWAMMIAEAVGTTWQTLMEEVQESTQDEHKEEARPCMSRGRLNYSERRSVK